MREAASAEDSAPSLWLPIGIFAFTNLTLAHAEPASFARTGMRRQGVDRPR